MNIQCSTVLFLFTFTAMISASYGFYIRNAAENESVKTKKSLNSINNKDEWSIFKQKLGLTNQKVDLLKSQKDQQGTLKLLNRFIEENPSYNGNKAKVVKTPNTESSKRFLKVYHNLLKDMTLSRSTLKTSVNFEFANTSQKKFKRSPHKIALRMVSDMPSEKIDDLLEMFNQKHGINSVDNDDDDALEEDDEYSDSRVGIPSAKDPDYMYENLYDDEEDLAVPAKSNHNSQYGSFQDLILQATRNQWQREIEETKLRNRNNEHFI